MCRVIHTNVAFLILISMLLFWSSFEVCSAREGKQWKQHKAIGLRRGMTAVTPQEQGGGSAATFNVLNYGTKGDGRSDDTKAFVAAWDAACKEEGATMMVPSGSEFLVRNVSFKGLNCQPNIVFQLDGTIIAPTSSDAWKSGQKQWIEFINLTGITIKGKGTIDGQGSVWWNIDSPISDPTSAESITTHDTISSELKGNMPKTKPTALRFYGSDGVTVTGITIKNSPQTHLKFDNCRNVQVSGFTASSPGNSPNTDGIHLENSQDVIISDTTLACGDDCVSIQTGCSNVYIHDVNCGPGHGISIGGLGNDNSKACVSNITVRDITIHNTDTGVRIKTWQGGSGAVQQVMFSNIQVSEVKIPIVIDQYYCDGKSDCKNQSSAVAVSGINYADIRGTFTQQPVRFACSDSSPCSGVSLSTIDLKSAQENHHLDGPFCWETYGELKTTTEPPINCLKTGKPTKAETQSNYESC